MKLLRRVCLTSLFVTIFCAHLLADDVRIGLVSYWPFETVNGNTTPDLVFGNHLVLNNMSAANLVADAGVRGSAFSFNGSNQYLGMQHTNDATLTNNLGLPIYSAKRYTVMFWAKGASNQNNKVVFSEGTSSTANGLFLLGTRNGTTASPAGGLNASIRTAGGTTILPNTLSATPAFDGTNWHQITWVDDAGTAKLYIDGTLDSTTYNYTQSAIAFNTIAIGALIRNTVGNYFAGSIDEVALWERTLTKNEIDDVRTNGFATPIPVFAPTITTQPVSPTNHVGDWVFLSTSVIGPRPFTYQWFKNNSAILDATNQTYRVPNLTTDNNGDTYYVVVTNPGGPTQSSSAVVTVLADAPVNIPSGLLSYWPMDLISNASTPDLYSKNDMALTSMDTTNVVSGQFGSALEFDGLTQYGTRTSGLPIYNNSNYTVAFWVKGLPNQTNKTIFGEGSITNGTPIFLLGTDLNGTNAGLDVIIRNNSVPGGNPINHRKSVRPVFDSVWHHIAWVDENGAGKLYVDGVLDDTDFNYTRGALTLDTTSVGAVARTVPINYFAGMVDDLAVWNRRLSFAEIQQIKNSGIPAPIADTPPSFTLQPVGTNTLSKVDLTLSAQVVGTSPISYQWRKDGNNMANATTSTLSLTNVQVGDSGAYTLVVTNVAGGATSSVAQVTITQRPAPPASLAIDFNNRGAGAEDTQPGFQAFTLPGTNNISTATTALFGGVEMTVSGSGSSLDSRRRTDVTNSVDFTGEKILQDFIFASTTTGISGMDVNFKYLAPNQLYAMTVWSFDSGNANRVSDWFANGTQVIDNYTFDGPTLPTNDGQYNFSFNVAADATGKITIQGRREASGTGAAVFLNAIKVEVPPVRITSGQFVNNTVSLTFFTPNPELTHVIQETSALGTTWTDVTGVTFTSTGANTMQADFAFPAGNAHFYRIARSAP